MVGVRGGRLRGDRPQTRCPLHRSPPMVYGPAKTVYGRSETFAHDVETEDLSMSLLTFENAGGYTNLPKLER